MKPILIIDGMNLLFRAGFTTGFLTLPDGSPCGAAWGFIRSTLAAYRSTVGKTGGKVAVVWDGGRSPRRLTMFPTYKNYGARLGSPDPNDTRANMKREERQMIFEQLPLIQQLLSFLGVDQYQRTDVEADDVISALTAGLADDRSVVILSSDNDFRQLVSDSVTLVHGNGEVVRKEDVPFRGDEVTVKCLHGCNSDAIPGLKGMGDVTARRLIGWIRNELYGPSRAITLEDLKELPDLIQKARTKPFGRVKAAVKIITEHGLEIPVRNQSLVDLSVPLEWEEVWDAATTPWTGNDMKSFVYECGKMAWNSMLNDLEDFEKMAFNSPV